MTTRRDTNPHEDLKALAVLGARFDAAIADCERPASRRRRPLVIVAFAVAILVVAPTVASVTLGYNPLRALGFNFHSTIERDLPQAAAVIDPKNPVATGEALEEPRHRGDLDSDRGRAAREWYPHEGYAYGRATRRHRDLVRPGHRGRMEDR